MGFETDARAEGRYTIEERRRCAARIWEERAMTNARRGLWVVFAMVDAALLIVPGCGGGGTGCANDIQQAASGGGGGSAQGALTYVLQPGSSMMQGGAGIIEDPVNGPERNLTDGKSFDQDPRFRPDGMTIAFWRTTATGADIYTINADGTGLSKITPEWKAGLSPAPGPRNADPSWSSDGQTIVFTNGGSPGASPSIAMMNSDGSGAKYVLTSSSAFAYGFASSPVLSPNGRTIAFDASTNAGVLIFEMNADGTGVPRPIPNPVSGGHMFNPRFSPNGLQLTYDVGVTAAPSSISNVYYSNADGTNPTPFTTDNGSSQPCFRKDNNTIVYVTTATCAHGQVFQRPLNSTDVTTITACESNETTQSPDAR